MFEAGFPPPSRTWAGQAGRTWGISGAGADAISLRLGTGRAATPTGPRPRELTLRAAPSPSRDRRGSRRRAPISSATLDGHPAPAWLLLAGRAGPGPAARPRPKRHPRLPLRPRRFRRTAPTGERGHPPPDRNGRSRRPAAAQGRRAGHRAGGGRGRRRCGASCRTLWTGSSPAGPLRATAGPRPITRAGFADLFFSSPWRRVRESFDRMGSAWPALRWSGAAPTSSSPRGSAPAPCRCP